MQPLPTYSYPHFCTGKLVLRAVVLAQAVAILLSFAPGAIEDRWFRLGLSTLFIQWVTLLSLLILCQVQKCLQQQSYKRLALIAFVTLLTCTSIVSVIAYSILTKKGWDAQADLDSFIIHNLLIATIVGIIGFQFYMMLVERHQRIAAQSRAELDALQARIRPHFLFNSLNTAAELTRQDPEAAEQALLNLSHLFRAALRAGEQSNLTTEIELVDAYLSLEQWRLGSRLIVERHYPNTLPNTHLPSLTLQPLIENAVRHGVEVSNQPTRIKIQILVSDQHITVLIENPVSETSNTRFKGNGMAISNIRQRLALLHEDQARLSTSLIDGIYRVKLVIPNVQEKP